MLSFGYLFPQTLDSAVRDSTSLDHSQDWRPAAMSDTRHCSCASKCYLFRIVKRDLLTDRRYSGQWQVLTALSSLCTNVAQGIALQALCRGRGLALGLLHNMALCRRLSIKCDHVTAVCTSLSAPLGDALIPPVMASTSAPAVQHTLGVLLLLPTLGSVFAFNALSRHVPHAVLILKATSVRCDTPRLCIPQ